MKLKTLKILIIISGLLSAALFTAVQFNEPPSFLMDERLVTRQRKLECGDLYNLCRVDRFDTELPYLRSVPDSMLNLSPDNADILVFGDSFFQNSRGMKTIPELIGDSLKMNVSFNNSHRPLITITESYNKSRRKILLFETIERIINAVFNKPHTLKDKEKNKISSREKLFPKPKEDNYLYILKNGKFTGNLYSALMSFRFNTFGIISDATPVYRTDPDWLFYFPDVIGKYGFYYNFSQDEIKELADKIQGLKEILDTVYNIEFVYVAVPNKYTLYSKYLNNDKYNGFIPRLNSELISRNINVINVYDSLKSSGEVLYYETDSHWNEKGEIFALNIILSKLREYQAGLR